jgi:hypothetical protein
MSHRITKKMTADTLPVFLLLVLTVIVTAQVTSVGFWPSLELGSNDNAGGTDRSGNGNALYCPGSSQYTYGPSIGKVSPLAFSPQLISSTCSAYTASTTNLPAGVTNLPSGSFSYASWIKNSGSSIYSNTIFSFGQGSTRAILSYNTWDSNPTAPPGSPSTCIQYTGQSLASGTNTIYIYESISGTFLTQITAAWSNNPQTLVFGSASQQPFTITNPISYNGGFMGLLTNPSGTWDINGGYGGILTLKSPSFYFAIVPKGDGTVSLRAVQTNYQSNVYNLDLMNINGQRALSYGNLNGAGIYKVFVCPPFAAPPLQFVASMVRNGVTNSATFSSVTVPISNWFHLILVWDDSNKIFNLFINGVLQNSIVIPDTGPSIASTGTFALGMDFGASNVASTCYQQSISTVYLASGMFATPTIAALSQVRHFKSF